MLKIVLFFKRLYGNKIWLFAITVTGGAVYFVLEALGLVGSLDLAALKGAALSFALFCTFPFGPPKLVSCKTPSSGT